MPTSRTRLAVAAFAVCGTVVTTAAIGVVPSVRYRTADRLGVTFTAPPGASLDDPQGVVAANGTSTCPTPSTTSWRASSPARRDRRGLLRGNRGERGTAVPPRPPRSTRRPPWRSTSTATSSSPTAEDNVVREITTDGVIHRVAGDGTDRADRGDGRPCHPAPSSTTPRAWPSTTKGDVFIADTYNNVVREVTPAGPDLDRRRRRHRRLLGATTARPRAPSFPHRQAWPSTPWATSTSPTRGTTSSAGSRPTG